MPDTPIEAPSRNDWNAVRDGLQPRDTEEPLFPFELDPATCTQGRWRTYLGLGSAWVDVHQTDAGTCEVWLGGETEDPRYDGRPTSYCLFPRTCEPLSASLPFDDGGPARIDSPYCTRPGIAPGPPCDLERAVLSACVTGPGIGQARPFEEPYTLSLDGVVEGVGIAGDDDCFRSETARVGRWIAHQATELETARWISVRTSDGNLFQVGVITPGFTWSVESGDPVAIELRSLLFAFAPDQANIEVRGANDALVYWLGLAGSLGGLTPPPELTVADAGIQCREPTECFEERRLHRVEITMGENTETVGYGDGATVDRLQVVHGGLESQYGASTCVDAYVAWASISAWTRPPAPLGRVAIGVTVQNGTGVAGVSYRATCGDEPAVSGSLDEQSRGLWSGSTELPVGDCQIALIVEDTSGEALCVGSTTFSVAAEELNELDARLPCGIGE